MEFAFTPAVAPAHAPMSQSSFWPKRTPDTGAAGTRDIVISAATQVPKDDSRGVFLDLYV